MRLLIVALPTAAKSLLVLAFAPFCESCHDLRQVR